MNMQGDFLREELYFVDIIKMLPLRGVSICDVGSGNVFSFEKRLRKIRGNIDKVDCIDIVKSPEKISYDIDNVFCMDLEKEIDNKKRYEVVICLEVMEHLDKTDVLIKNCKSFMRRNGVLFFAIPNLASLYSRIELALGFQPHILEISNENGTVGQGIFGKINNPDNVAIHHIRGITYKACKELLEYHGLDVVKTIGSGHTRLQHLLFNKVYSIAPEVVFVCKKKRMT